ncbi:MAG: sulfide-dependent adenosine diphosphate thiazole synthase [Clostridiales bacterium]|nr:sulfide-dependent adenosine diphosphate thiazole synthase [Clostridiales bacterium]MCF8021309.1 sulfide-dependent adenosine diphosphate thiazole synthase [Clostridiales bacterium]
MLLDDTKISKAIINTYNEELIEALHSDVAIVGAGPSGLAAAYYLARKGKKVAIFERKLSIGGGMWGGGMMMNKAVFQEDAKEIFDEFNINYKEYDQGYYVANCVECVAALSLKAVQAGARIFNLVSVEDVMTKDDYLAGLVLNWTPVDTAGLHVDPLMVDARFVLDATGHDAVIVNQLVNKMGAVLKTKNGMPEGEKPMWADRGEEQVVANTGEVYPGLYVSGMAANATYGGQRMGPVFGGMLLSGSKVARELLERL